MARTKLRARFGPPMLNPMRTMFRAAFEQPHARGTFLCAIAHSEPVFREMLLTLDPTAHRGERLEDVLRALRYFMYRTQNTADAPLGDKLLALVMCDVLDVVLRIVAAPGNATDRAGCEGVMSHLKCILISPTHASPFVRKVTRSMSALDDQLASSVVYVM